MRLSSFSSLGALDDSELDKAVSAVLGMVVKSVEQLPTPEGAGS
jgi:hypothetical protein